MKLLGLTLFDSLFKDKHQETSRVVVVAKLTALREKHRYLIDLRHHIGKEEFQAVDWLFLHLVDRLAALVHICTSN